MLLGFQVFRARSPCGKMSGKSLGSGQPSVLIGQRAEENQVSRTSGSWTKPICLQLDLASMLVLGTQTSRCESHAVVCPHPVTSNQFGTAGTSSVIAS